MTRTGNDSRVRQIAVGFGILGSVGLMLCGALIGWRYVPGVAGEWLGTMVGVMMTPFFLETSFVCIGLTLVVTINHWRQKRDGDELVYLEQVKGAEGLPEHAKWAVYRERPLPGETPSLQTQAEGALAIGDHAAAAECIAAMTEEELKHPETLELRLELAQATGRTDLARQLAEQLGNARNGER